LNTSFNDNEPIVCRPEEALDCFRRTQMDVLVVGNFILEKKLTSGVPEENANNFAKRAK
jgi:predicted NodU family carbamoyl transferase